MLWCYGRSRSAASIAYLGATSAGGTDRPAHRRWQPDGHILAQGLAVELAVEDMAIKRCGPRIIDAPSGCEGAPDRPEGFVGEYCHCG